MQILRHERRRGPNNVCVKGEGVESLNSPHPLKHYMNQIDGVQITRCLLLKFEFHEGANLCMSTTNI